MEPVIDLSKEYGIVLEGGGAKGAYQIGAWKALKEAGVKIKGIAGTSVGALNGALMCMGDYENAQKVWETISYSRVMDVNDDNMNRLFAGELPLKEFMQISFQAMKDGGVDVTPLKELIALHVDAEKILHSPMDFYAVTFDVDEMKELDVDMKALEPELIPDFLLASAYLFPLFKNEKLHGKMYIDAGAFDNVPVGSLVSRGYKDIITLRIFGVGREKKVEIPQDVNIYSVQPRVDLGSIIEFDSERSRLNMRVGYFDAMRMIYNLAGTIYYIVENLTETDFLEKICRYTPDENLRKYVEITIPLIAIELKLGPAWTYRDLYIGMIEATAKLCRIPKYRIYTLEELEKAIGERSVLMDRDTKLPNFAQIILKLQQEEEKHGFERT